MVKKSRTLWRQKMDRLVYGRDPCKDLLKLEKEFEQLRIKLFPTSSSDPAMNAEVGRLYAAAIERGSPLLAAEMQRILAVLDQEPSLSQWKSAAVKAEQNLKLTAVNWRAGGGGQEYPRWGHRPGGESHTQTTGAVGRVHEMSEGVEGEDDTDNPGAALQQVQGRKDSYRRTPSVASAPHDRRSTTRSWPRAFAFSAINPAIASRTTSARRRDRRGVSPRRRS